MQYCRICGSENKQRIANGNYKDDLPVSNSNWYKYEGVCQKGHISYSNHADIVPKGKKAVRTIASNGYQTSHIDISLDESKFRDENFHGVNISDAFYEEKTGEN